MRGMYAIAFSATALILLFCVWKLEGSKTTLAKAMQKLLLVADFEVLLHIGLMHSTDMTFSLVFFGLFYAAMDWLLFFLFWFNMTFVGNRMEDYVKMPLMYAVLICDSVLVFLGGIFGYSYVCVEQTMSDGSLYIWAQHLPFFNVHLGVSYLLLLLAFIPLIYKAVKAQAFYRKKYVIVIALLLLVAVADAIYMLTESNIDISVLGYALSAVLIYYYALIYEPQQLTNRTYQLMVHDMAEGVILLDADGKVVRANKSAYEIFGHEERAVGTTVAPDFWTDAEKMKEFEGKTWEWTKEKEDGTHYLEATFQCLMDKKERFIGGFFVVKDKYENRGCNNTGKEPLWFWDGDYNDGVDDMGYRELYTRWLQFGAFLPIFRSHGTDTPREPWNFGTEGDMFYDTIVSFIRLRYQLMPYIYSLGAKAHRDSYIIMRSLVFDFSNDENALSTVDEYMFGDAFLVAPVYQAMYYGVNSQELMNTQKERQVYLPNGIKWYDFWTNQVYDGGQYVQIYAPIDRMPLLVKAGSIIPFSDDLEYADEKDGIVAFLRIYEGADGSFVLYNDAGDGYEYEQGMYTAITIQYYNEKKEVIFSSVEGKYPIQNSIRIQYVGLDGMIQETEVSYCGKETCYKL